MGYHTDFRGGFEVTPPLQKVHENYINKFSETRRMKRDPDKLEDVPDPIRKAVNLGIGEDGEFFVGSKEHSGQDFSHPSVVDGNRPPSSQPGLWCQWIVIGDTVQWDGGEKFYNYTEWLQYLIDNFFKPWGYTLNGQVDWRGEDWSDTGTIQVINNKIKTLYK